MTSQEIEQRLASRIKTEKPQDVRALLRGERPAAADQLVVGHTAIDECYGAPGGHAHASAEWQARPQQDGIQKIAFEADVLRDRAVVVRAGQR